jgi:7-keto-8-aminopelargonate synthetase-like enzyme
VSAAACSDLKHAIVYFFKKGAILNATTPPSNNKTHFVAVVRGHVCPDDFVWRVNNYLVLHSADDLAQRVQAMIKKTNAPVGTSFSSPELSRFACMTCGH